MQISIIQSQLIQSPIQWTVSFNDITGSTNDDVMQAKAFPALAVAGSQRSGRGRRANQWHAQKGDLLFSVACASNRSLHNALSLQVGCAVAQTLNQHHPDPCFHVKWPNDVLWVSETEVVKVGGILVEKKPQNEGNLWVVGVGINLASSPVMHRIKSTAETLIVQIASQAYNLVDQPQALDVEVFNALHALNQSDITFMDGSTVKQGKVVGVGGDGALRIEQEGRITHYHHIHSLRRI